MQALLSLYEWQALQATRQFVLGAVSTSIFHGSVDQLVLTVSQVIQGTIAVGDPIQDALGLLKPNSRIIDVMSGSGGTGTYQTAFQQSVPLIPMYGGVEVIKGQNNRVAEPYGADFVVMTPMRQDRLSTNVTDYADDVLLGSIDGDRLTVYSLLRNQGPLTPGTSLLDTVGVLLPGTQLGPQLDGSPGNFGTYAVAPSQAVPQQIMYAGLRSDLVPTQLSVQLDFHGPHSGDNVRIVEGLLRSEYGVDSFEATGYAVAPLYASDARQAPFVNAEQQTEYRWTLDVELQANPVIGTLQQFADVLRVTTRLTDDAPIYADSSTGDVTELTVPRFSAS